MMEHTIFRKEAVQHRLNQSLGTISVNLPLSYQWVSLGGITLMFSILLFIIYADYSFETECRGYLNTKDGITTLWAEGKGIIEEQYVQEGMKVKKNSVLY